MKKVYINPAMHTATIAASTNFLGASNVQYTSGNKTSSMTGKIVSDAKDRDDDYESDGWSDGLW